MNQKKAMCDAPLAGGALPQHSAYGLPASESQAAQRFFTELRKHGLLRLACAAAGWRRAKMESWKQPRNQDGTENRHHNPEFALAVEQAICQFQSELLDRLLDDGEDVDSSRWRAPAWVLERLFRSEFARANSAGRAAKPETGYKK